MRNRRLLPDESNRNRVHEELRLDRHWWQHDLNPAKLSPEMKPAIELARGTMGIHGNSKQEVVYLIYWTDSSGQMLAGTR